MHFAFRTTHPMYHRIGLVSMIAWVAFPGVLAMLPPQYLLVFSVCVVATISLLLCIELFTIQFYILQKKTFDRVSHLGLGLVAQILLLMTVVLYRIPSIPPLTELGFIVQPFFLYIILPQVIVALVTVIGKPFLPIRFASKVWVIGLVLLVIGIAWSAFQWYSIRQRSLGYQTATEERVFDDNSLAYNRSAEKIQTTLGQLPRPLTLLYKDGAYVGIPQKGDSVPLPFIDVTLDNNEPVFFDVYQDRLFYTTKEKLYLYDVKKKQSIPVVHKGTPFTIPADQALAGVYGNYFALQKEGGFAGTSEQTVYDLRTGGIVTTGTVAGYDITRVYSFTVNNEQYQLALDSKGNPDVRPAPGKPGYTRVSQRQDATMRFYLNNAASPNFVLPKDGEIGSFYDSSLIDTWSEIVFTGGQSIYFSDQTPIFTLPSPKKVSKNYYDEDKFSVRNLYQVSATEVALEVNNGLVIVNLSNQKTHFVADPVSMSNYVKNATLISTDTDEQNAGYCTSNNELYHILVQEGYRFIFCLL